MDNEYIKEQKMLTDSGEAIHLPCYLTGFMIDIQRMNDMYRMPEVGNTVVEKKERLTQFKSILEEECKEIDDVNSNTALSDLLGDIIVYCASEARRWNIPIDRVLNIIMQSNFSKLGADGKPIYDERMKLQKGPNYWKPEPAIEKMLSERNNHD